MSFFDSRSQLFVSQQKEWTEILIDWETKNRYVILDAGHTVLGHIAEKSGGFAAFLSRGFLRSHRPLDVGVFDREGALLFHLTRPFFFLFSSLSIEDEHARSLGRVERRFGVFYRKYDLIDEAGNRFAEVKGPRWHIWTFHVREPLGLHEATITKRWGGGLREIFSDADTFLIDFGKSIWSDSQRRVIFAAAISIDFDFFENNQGSQGLVGNFDPLD